MIYGDNFSDCCLKILKIKIILIMTNNIIIIENILFQNFKNQGEIK